MSLEILQITNRLPWPLNDGGNIATWQLSKALIDRGHRICLASLNTRKHFQNPKDIPGLAEIHTVDIDTTVTRSGLVRGLFSSFPYNVKRFWSDDFAALLEKLVRDNDFDLVQLEGSYLSQYIPVLRKAGAKKIVLRSHNVEHQIWDRLAGEEKNFLKRVYLKNLSPKIRRFEKGQLLTYDGIAAITPEDARWYQHTGFSGKLKVLPAGADLKRFQPSDQLKTGRLGFLGSMEWMPNVQGLKWFLQEVWTDLYQSFPDKELHVAGKNPPDWMGNWKVAGMHFHGMVPDAAAYLQQIDIFLVPLLSGGGMRLKILEAMSAGNCVLSTSIGAEGIAAKDGEEIWIADTPTQMREKLEMLLRKPEIARATAAKALKLVRETYTWDKIAEGFSEFYGEVLA